MKPKTDYKTALRDCWRVGAANASGAALRAMYAQLISGMQGGDPKIYFEWLPKRGHNAISEAAIMLLRDRAKAWDVLIGIEV